MGEGCIGFCCRSVRNSSFHGNLQLSKSYNGKNGVITFSHMFLIGSFSYLQVTMTCMRAWMSSKFGRIRPRTTELVALEYMKKSRRVIMGKTMSSHFFPLFLIGSFLYMQVMRTCIRAWMSLKFGQMRPLVSMATDRVTVGKTASSRFLECF